MSNYLSFLPPILLRRTASSASGELQGGGSGRLDTHHPHPHGAVIVNGSDSVATQSRRDNEPVSDNNRTGRIVHDDDAFPLNTASHHNNILRLSSSMGEIIAADKSRSHAAAHPRKEREIKLKDFKFAIDLADTLGDTYLQTKNLMRLTLKDNFRIDSMTNIKVFWTDEVGRVVLWNEEMAKCTGITKDYGLGKHLHELIHDNYRGEIDRALNDILSHENAAADVNVFFDVEGVIKRMVLHGVARRSSSQGVIGAFFIAEEVLSNCFDRSIMRDGLGENFQRLLHGVNVKIFGVNKNGGIDIWNEKMHSATGLAPEEMLGKPLSVLRVTNEVSTLEVVIDAALKGKETFKYCYTLKSPSGVLSTVEMDVTTRRDARNYIIGALCVAQDHEGEDDMTAALESAQSALEKAMEQLQHEKLAAGDAAEKESRTRAMLDMKRRFVRGVGHEIRTPLNVVFAGLQLLESRLRGVVEDDILEVIEDMKSSCRDAIDILDDLLSYEKIDSQLLQIETSPLDIQSFIKESLKPFAVQAKLKQVAIRYFDTSAAEVAGQEKPVGPMLNVDKHKIGQVLRNLISNAVKFTKHNGNIDVSVFWKKEASDKEAIVEDGWIRIEVKDEGPGISKDNQAKLFNSIVQFNAKQLQNGGGSGIGLWVTKGIVDLHKGLIGVDSDGEGFGSTFYVELPLLKSEYDPLKDGELSLKLMHERELKRVEGPPTLSKSSSDRGGVVLLKVLVADDAPLCRTMLKRILTKECKVLDEAEDGIDAVNKVMKSMKAGQPYDLVLMDGNMPRMGGHEATSIMRLKGYKGCVVGVTGDVFPEEINNFKSHGADIVMVKPINIESLSEYLQGIRDSKRTLRLPILAEMELT